MCCSRHPRRRVRVGLWLLLLCYFHSRVKRCGTCIFLILGFVRRCSVHFTLAYEKWAPRRYSAATHSRFCKRHLALHTFFTPFHTSPTLAGSTQLVFKAPPAGDAATTSAVLQRWREGRVVSELQVPKALQGPVVNDGYFASGAVWNRDESAVAYTAEVGRGGCVVMVIVVVVVCGEAQPCMREMMHHAGDAT